MHGGAHLQSPPTAVVLHTSSKPTDCSSLTHFFKAHRLRSVGSRAGGFQIEKYSSSTSIIQPQRTQSLGFRVGELSYTLLQSPPTALGGKPCWQVSNRKIQ